MLGDRLARRVSERGHAEIADLTPRQIGGPFDKVLRLFIEPESESLDAAQLLPFGLGLFARQRACS